MRVGLQMHREIDVPEGEALLRTGIYDPKSGKAGTLGTWLGKPMQPWATARKGAAKASVAPGVSNAVLAIANSSMARYKPTEPSTLNHIERGARMYFARMSCGHLREGFRAIQAVRDDPVLAAFVNRCEPYAQAAFADLCECLEAGKNHTEFEKYVLSIRNKASFHYESNQITSALEDRVNRPTSSGVCSITMGENIHSNRLEFADAILDKVWLAFKVRDWAKRRGRTNRAWFICALLFLIPTVIVLVLLPKMPVITMQHSSRHQIDLSVPEANWR
jgi:hypothetical protein